MDVRDGVNVCFVGRFGLSGFKRKMQLAAVRSLAVSVLVSAVWVPCDDHKFLRDHCQAIETIREYNQACNVHIGLMQCEASGMARYLMQAIPDY